MKKKIDELTIDGEVYVPKSSIGELKMANNDYPIYMVRTYSAGVFFGGLKERVGKEVVLADARRVWYWDGAASLSQLAVYGTSKPENCKFPCEVEEITLTEATEIISCSEQAQRSIKEVKIWKS